MEWNFLEATLRKFNYGEDFIAWIKCCYSDIFSCVMNNGYSTGWFKLQRGMRQGCALSCFLFILCVEIMACQIRENNQIHGITINDNEHKLKQFADDCTCTLQNTNSIYLLIDTIDNFTQVSGLKLNLEKSLLFFLGPWRFRKDDILGMKIAYHTFNMLGIYVGRGKEEKQQLNFYNKILKMNSVLRMWSQRDLSLCGRILTTKTFGISNLVYSLSMMDANRDVITSAQRELNRFIWHYKTSKVKHSAMMATLGELGLNSIDMESQAKALRLPWLNRIIKGSGWSDFSKLYLDRIGGLQFLLQCNYQVECLPDLPLFYLNMLRFSKELFKCKHMEEIIWNNKFITIEGKSIYYKEWHSRGVIFIQDLCDSQGNWLTFEAFVTKFGIRTNYLRFFGIVSAVKKMLYSGVVGKMIDLKVRPLIQFETNVLYVDTNELINISLAKSKSFYDFFIRIKIEEPACALYWSQNYNVSNDLLFNSLNLCKIATKEAKIMSLQFKVVHNITNCGVNLKKWGIRDSDLCLFCDENVSDTLVHALVDCKKSRELIEDVFDLLNTNYLLDNITQEEYLFGVNDPACNLLCLTIKSYLYRKRMLNDGFSVRELLNDIYKRVITDKHTLSDGQFHTKWGEHELLLELSLQYYNSLH